MNEEIPCVTNEVKMAKNEWENDDSDFLPALYILYKKSGQIFFHTCSRCICCVTSYKHLNKLINEV